MRIIKNAFVYSVPTLPAMDLMTVTASDYALQPLAAASQSSIGFVQNALTGCWVTPIAGGYSFVFQIDEKVLPPAAVSKRLAAAVADIEARQGRTVYRKERLEIKDDVLARMLPVAFVVSRQVVAFYNATTRILMLDTGSAKVADMCIDTLREALGGLKAIKLHIDHLCFTLTQRVLSFDDGTVPTFGTLDLGGQITLADPEGAKVTFVADNGAWLPLDEINQLIRDGMYIKSLALIGRGAEFKLNVDDCVFKSVRISDSADDQEIEDVGQLWAHEAGIEALIMQQQITDLLALTGSIFPPADEDTED